MPLIEYNRLYIKNYSSIKEAEIPLSGVGLCLIEGMVNGDPDKSNGAGKTSLAEAFYFGITGEFFDSSTTHALVVNRFIKEDLEIIIEGKKHEKSFKIHRVIEKKKTKTKHILDFFINGENQTETTTGIGEVQEKINEFLGTTPILFLNSKIFGQGEISSFTKVDDRHKKVIIDNLIGIGIFEKLYKRTKEHISKCSTMLTTKNLERDNLRNALNANKKRITELVEQETSWKVKIDNEVKQIDDIIKKLTTEKLSLDTVKQTVSCNPLDVVDYDEQFKVLEGMEKQLDERKTSTEQMSLDAERDQMKLQFAIQKEGDDANKLLSEFQNLSQLSLSDSTCPTCKQPLNSEHIPGVLTNILDQVKIHTSKKEELQKELSEKELLSVNIKELLQKTTSALTQIKGDITKTRSLMVEQEKKKTELARLTGKCDNLSTQIAIYQKKRESTLASESPYTTLITNIQAEIKQLEPKINSYVDELKQLEKDHLYYGLLAKAFDRNGIPDLISRKAIDILNVLLKKYTQRILGPKFSIKFITVDKGGKSKIQVDVDHEDGGPTYARCSKGERKLIDLCQAFALSKFADTQNKCNFNVMWFDEVFAELDPSHCGALLEVLKQDPTSSKFVITHKDLFKEEFRSRISIQKVGNTSNVFVTL